MTVTKIDHRNRYGDKYWNQGRLIKHSGIKDWDPDLKATTQEVEERMAFINFGENSTGHSSKFVYGYNSSEECTVAINKHNTSLTKLLKFVHSTGTFITNFTVGVWCGIEGRYFIIFWGEQQCIYQFDIPSQYPEIIRKHKREIQMTRLLIGTV